MADKPTRDVTDIYELARFAANGYQTGEQVSIPVLMRAAYQHGFADAMLRVIATGLVPQDKLVAAFFQAASSGHTSA